MPLSILVALRKLLIRTRKFENHARDDITALIMMNHFYEIFRKSHRQIDRKKSLVE